MKIRALFFNWILNIFKPRDYCATGKEILGRIEDELYGGIPSELGEKNRRFLGMLCDVSSKTDREFKIHLVCCEQCSSAYDRKPIHYNIEVSLAKS